MLSIHQPTRSLLLHHEDPLYIRELIPASKILPVGDYSIAVKHNVASTKILRNIGIDAPSPILTYYDWPGKFTPYDHQRQMAEFWTLNKRGFNLSDPGAMKTSAALWAADWLMSIGAIQRVLILAPLSTLDRTWANEVFSVLMHRIVTVVHGSREKRLQALAVPADFYVLNHDGIKISAVADAIHKRDDISLVIVDEGDTFRNGNTQLYKTLRKMLRPDMRIWWQTGTPCPNAPTDAWAQARIVNPSRVPKYFGAFQRATMMQVTPFKWVPRNDAYTMAYDAMQPAIRFRTDECVDLPPVLPPMERQAELTSEQRAALRTMQSEMVVELKDQPQIVAVNAADKIGKIRQILCGALKNPTTDDYIQLDHAPRLQLLLDMVSKASAKVLVIVPFKGILRVLADQIAEHYTVDVLNGDVSAGQRNKIIRNFKETPDPHILACHPQVMSHGLNLTEADMLIFYAPIYSNAQFQQVVGRPHRVGQTYPLKIVRIGAHPIEWEIYKALDAKGVTQTNILNLYKKFAEGEYNGL